MKKRRQGIVLLIGLVIAVVAFMFIGASLALGPAGQASARQSAEQSQAQRAAESGVQYCLAQLRRNPDWRGDANTITINNADMFVVEDRGNVVGLIQTPDGAWSQFRLRFNPQDGSDDPSLWIDHPYVSVNNLKGGAAAPVPRATGPNFSLSPGASAAFMVPTRAVSLAVEGRSALSGLGPSNPNPAPGLSRVSRAVVEGLYQIGGGTAEGDDSAAMAAGGFETRLQGSGAVSFQSKTGGHIPRIRSKRNVLVSGGNAAQNLVSPSGVVATRDSTLQASYNSSQVSVKEEKPVDPFYQLAWSDLKTADPAGPRLDAGTYVWWEDGSLHYYDLGYADYVRFIQANPTDPGSPAVLPGNVKTVGTTLEIDSSLYVKGTSNTKDLTVINRQGAPEDPPGSGTPVDVVAATIVNQGSERQFFATCNYGSGNVTVNDAGGNPMFSATWSTATDPNAYTFSFSSNGPYTRLDLFRFLLNPSLYPGSSAAPGSTFQSQAGQLPWVSTTMGIDPTAAPGVINPPGVTDSLTAADLGVTFKGDHKPVTLSGDGSIRLTGKVQGTGGSITAGGDIRITGLGADFSAAPTSTQAVNMYARGDVTFSTLQPEGAGLGYANVHLKGIVYSWGDFIAKLGNEALPANAGTLKLDGSLIAYGGDPAVEQPGQNGRGLVKILADSVDLTFDPSYLGALDSKLPANFKLERVSWSNRLP